MKPFKNYLINYTLCVQFLDYLRENGYIVGGLDWYGPNDDTDPQLYDASMAYLNQYADQLNNRVFPTIFQCASDMSNDEMMQLYLDFYEDEKNNTVYTAMILRPEMLEDEEFRRDYPDLYENYRDILYEEEEEKKNAPAETNNI